MPNNYCLIFFLSSHKTFFGKTIFLILFSSTQKPLSRNEEFRKDVKCSTKHENCDCFLAPSRKFCENPKARCQKTITIFLFVENFTSFLNTFLIPFTINWTSSIFRKFSSHFFSINNNVTYNP